MSEASGRFRSRKCENIEQALPWFVSHEPSGGKIDNPAKNLSGEGSYVF